MLDFTLHTWDVVEALGLKNPILVGHSMGGMIAAEMAAVAPARRLAPGAHLPGGPVARRASDSATSSPRCRSRCRTICSTTRRPARQAIGADFDLTDPKFLQTYLVSNARQLGMRGQDPVPDSRTRPGRRLYRIKAKTCSIWGDSDRLIPPAYAQAFKSGLKSADLIMIPDAGHMVAFEKTAEVAKAIHAAYLN